MHLKLISEKSEAFPGYPILPLSSYQAPGVSPRETSAEYGGLLFVKSTLIPATIYTKYMPWKGNYVRAI